MEIVFWQGLPAITKDIGYQKSERISLMAQRERERERKELKTGMIVFTFRIVEYSVSGTNSRFSVVESILY